MLPINGFATSSPATTAWAATELRVNGAAAEEHDAVALAISKAVRQLLFITRSYDLTLCDASIDDLKADLELMLRHNDLSSIRLELLGADGKVLVEFLLTFNGLDGNGRGIIDTGRGIELPMFDRTLVKGKRLVIQQNGLEAAYKHLLRIPWHKARNIPKSQGAAYESDHAAKISGGRQSAKFHVGDVARHRFVITQTGNKGFGFAKDLDAGHDGVFVLAKQLPAEIKFAVGTHFSALLVQTPRGFQVRTASAA